MRQFLALAAVVSLAASAAQAQFHPAPGYHPYEPPKNAYALPEQPRPVQPPKFTFEPPHPSESALGIKPPKHVNLDEDSRGYYPELHRKPKRRAQGGY